MTSRISPHCPRCPAGLSQLKGRAGWPAPVVVDLPARPRISEVLRYLGIPSPSAAGLGAPLRDRLDRALEWAAATLQPQGALATYAAAVGTAEVQVYTGDGVLTLNSVDLVSTLQGASLISLLAVTVGEALDAEVARLSEAGQLTDAAILDAVGSDCVEAAADALNDQLTAIAAGSGYLLTERFSPGYGDLGLAVQPQLVSAAGARVIGVTVQPSLMMLPLKSITAIIGWLAAPSGPELAPADRRDHPCSRCDAAGCRYRRLPRRQEEGEAQ